MDPAKVRDFLVGETVTISDRVDKQLKDFVGTQALVSGLGRRHVSVRVKTGPLAGSDLFFLPSELNKLPIKRKKPVLEEGSESHQLRKKPSM